ncbi:MAG: glycosyltransferase family 4 protein [Gammaproteobacteria bacterium]|nr:glycosyltransferase family 4 protein [Gammaproteobacteria bacterium]MCP5196488.1 glycosyltransferase family 4 protein [Gammaproteobacteria bacterium]
MKASEPLHIALVGPLPPPSGGMANQTRQLARLLEQEKIIVELVQVNSPYHPQWIGRLPGARAIFRLLPYLVRLWRALSHADVAHIMANSGWAWHLFAVPAIIISRLQGVPVIINYRGGNAGAFMQRQAWIVLPIMRQAKIIAVPSTFLAELFKRYSLPAMIVPNIVDLDRFKAAANSMVRPPILASPHLIVTRNLEAIYDISTALKAFRQIYERWPNARLTIAGSGPERTNLEAESAQLGLTDAVRFSGRLELQAMSELYANAQIMLNPSRVDNMPNSVLEAWASGVAVVSTDVGGVPHLVRDGEDAVLVPPGDSDAMASAVVRLLEAPGQMEKLINAGRDSVERFSWTQVKPLWMALYQDLARVKLDKAYS